MAEREAWTISTPPDITPRRPRLTVRLVRVRGTGVSSTMSCSVMTAPCRKDGARTDLLPWQQETPGPHGSCPECRADIASLACCVHQSSRVGADLAGTPDPDAEVRTKARLAPFRGALAIVCGPPGLDAVACAIMGPFRRIPAIGTDGADRLPTADLACQGAGRVPPAAASFPTEPVCADLFAAWARVFRMAFIGFQGIPGDCCLRSEHKL